MPDFLYDHQPLPNAIEHGHPSPGSCANRMVQSGLSCHRESSPVSFAIVKPQLQFTAASCPPLVGLPDVGVATAGLIVLQAASGGGRRFFHGIDESTGGTLHHHHFRKTWRENRQAQIAT